MSVYPFYVEVNSTTRKNKTGVGCRTKTGSVETTIYQREEGAITTPYKVVQHSYIDPSDGVQYLETTVYYFGTPVSTHRTKY